jgi:predicted dehydrogenase
MYRYHPQTKAIIDMIRSNELGELISMKSFFGQAIMKKKRLFGFNRTTFNKKNRLFNKKLAGGAVLDLGCYPITMTTLVAGLNHRIDYDNIALKHRELEYVSTGVDVDAYATLCFADGFTSLVGCSFKKSLGQATTIVGSKGELTIEHSWHCSPSTITMKGKKINLGFNQYDNIFCYEIESISQSVIQGECMPNFPAVNRHDTVHHMNLIDRWLCDDKE